MNKFFGKKKNDKETSPTEAIKKLRDIKEMLDKKQIFLEKKIENEIEIAKRHGMKNKRAALQALARKKRFEKQLQQMDGVLTTIEFQIEAVENATTNTEILKAMKQASTALKSSHQNMDVDKVNDILDDLNEQQELAKEIADAISNPVGFGHDFDDDELMAELELLQEENLKENLTKVDNGNVVKLPSVPSHEVVGTSKTKKEKDKKEDKELEELQNWAS